MPLLLLCVCPRFLLGLLNGMMAASKTLVAEVCGKKHEAAGMNVVTSESYLDCVPCLVGLIWVVLGYVGLCLVGV